MDERIRRLERQALATNDIADFLAWFRERVRAGAGSAASCRFVVVWASYRVYPVVRWRQRFDQAAIRARQLEEDAGHPRHRALPLAEPIGQLAEGLAEGEAAAGAA